MLSGVASNAAVGAVEQPGGARPGLGHLAVLAPGDFDSNPLMMVLDRLRATHPRALFRLASASKDLRALVFHPSLWAGLSINGRHMCGYDWLDGVPPLVVLGILGRLGDAADQGRGGLKEARLSVGWIAQSRLSYGAFTSILSHGATLHTLVVEHGEYASDALSPRVWHELLRSTRPRFPVLKHLELSLAVTGNGIRLDGKLDGPDVEEDQEERDPLRLGSAEEIAALLARVIDTCPVLEKLYLHFAGTVYPVGGPLRAPAGKVSRSLREVTVTTSQQRWDIDHPSFATAFPELEVLRVQIDAFFPDGSEIDAILAALRAFPKLAMLSVPGPFDNEMKAFELRPMFNAMLRKGLGKQLRMLDLSQMRATSAAGTAAAVADAKRFWARRGEDWGSFAMRWEEQLPMADGDRGMPKNVGRGFEGGGYKAEVEGSLWDRGLAYCWGRGEIKKKRQFDTPVLVGINCIMPA
ncbi:hypothetical protein DFJ74DRAFT_771597 [Hyaloraphidium curvatum]|nr:hypothetical protein DFJ74DRAFT_771597 [Hyaloraphidium curvatum]